MTGYSTQLASLNCVLPSSMLFAKSGESNIWTVSYVTFTMIQ